MLNDDYLDHHTNWALPCCSSINLRRSISALRALSVWNDDDDDDDDDDDGGGGKSRYGEKKRQVLSSTSSASAS